MLSRVPWALAQISCRSSIINSDVALQTKVLGLEACQVQKMVLVFLGTKKVLVFGISRLFASNYYLVFQEQLTSYEVK